MDEKPAEKDNEQVIIKLTAKQGKFCYEYCWDFNATQAAIRAGYSQKTAKVIGCENLTKPYIQSQIKKLQVNLSETAGISRLMVLREHQKLAFSSIAHLHLTWVTRKDFELNPTVFLETKGRFTAADRKKHLQFRESNPNITIAFLFQEAYNTLSRSSKTTYADWATKNNFLWFDWKTQQTELQSFISKHSPKPHKVLSSLKANFRRKK